jgi:magnesium transporter
LSTKARLKILEKPEFHKEKFKKQLVEIVCRCYYLTKNLIALMDRINFEEIKKGRLRWINIPKATEHEMSYLEENFKFHHLDLEDCLTENQRSKIDEYDDYLFIILHLPIINKRTRRIQSTELNVFVAKNLLITVHENNPIINKIFKNCQENEDIRKTYMSNQSGFTLYSVVNELFENVFPITDDIAKNLNAIENELFEDNKAINKIREILLLKKDLINFRRIVMPQRAVLAQLEHTHARFSDTDISVYFDNVVDKIEKIFSLIENLKDLASSLHETNESIVGSYTNNSIKVLTGFSVLMLPLTVITGFYGMNLQNLPFTTDEGGIHIVAGIMITTLVSMVAYLKIKDWI